MWDRAVMATCRRALAAWVAGVVLAVAGLMAPAGVSEAATGQAPEAGPPVFLHFYIWYQPSSWNRAKVDYPVLGRYSSDDEAVLRQQLAWISAAGVDGLVVSWKSTTPLNRRLQMVADLAAELGLDLAIIYQGLDFERNALPLQTVAADLELFARRWGDHPAFQRWERPVVIWNGTEKRTVKELASVTGPLADRLQLLAAEKSVEGYERVAPAFEGDAYYWSSVDPLRNTRHRSKLAEMGAAVHADRGLWMAPAAPGYDSRLLGGKSVVERRAGETLRRSFDAAAASNPDVIGIISWNEFSENTHVEPSVEHGTTALETVAELLGGRSPDRSEIDRSALDGPSDEVAEGTGGGDGRDYDGVTALALFSNLLVVAFVLLAMRRS